MALLGGSVGEKDDEGAEKELSEKCDDDDDDNKNMREKERDRTGISERKTHGEDRTCRSKAQGNHGGGDITERH